MKLVKTVLLLAVTALISFSMLYAKPEYTKTTGQKCATCHSKGKELNEVGKCYAKTKKLDGCKANEGKSAR